MSSELPDDILGVDDQGDGGGGGDDDEDVERRRMVLFRIGRSLYAVQVDAVRTVVEPGDLTDVPQSSPAIEGVMDLRGDITAVIDPHVHFASAEVGDERDRRIVVIDRGPDRQAAGFLVDEVRGVDSIPAPYFYDVEEVETETEEFRRTGDLVVAFVQRPDDDGMERIGVLDTEAVVQASERSRAESST